MKEVDVTLTDYALALEAMAFAVLIARAPSGTSIQRWFVVFFAATAAASLLGGTVHGYFNDSKGLWQLVLVALGVVSAAAWAVAADLLFTDRIARFVTLAAWIEFVAYTAIILLVTDNFAVAIANYLPSTLFLIAGFVVAYRNGGGAPLALGLSGLILTLVAAGVQQARISLHPAYFNHNALYHLLQGIALFLIFCAGSFLAAASR